MLSKICNGLGHIGIPCKNVEESARFYESLGFVRDLVYIDNEFDVAFLGIGSCVLELYKFDNLALKPGAVDHFCVDTDDIHSCFETVVNSGKYTLIDKEIQNIPFCRYFMIEGPSGEKIEFSQKTIDNTK